MFKSIINGLFKNRQKNKIKFTPRGIKLILEPLENRVVPSYIWSAPNTTVDANFHTPGNWFNTSTGTFATTSPDSNTDCVFSATSPTTCIDQEGSYCRSITTDHNWLGNITVNSNGLHILGGTSLIQGGTFTSSVDGRIYVIQGASLDYDAPYLNTNPAFPLGLAITVDTGGTFKVDKDCITIENTTFELGGLNSAGTLILNTNTSGNFSYVYTSPLGKVITFTPPPVSHNFLWSPTTTDTNWNNPNNWVDSVTGLKETNAPGANDNVVFGATSPTRCDLFTNGSCQTITTDASWNGHIVLHGSKLTVNGTNAPTGKSSAIDGGSIDVIFGGTIDEIGGEFDYAVSELGNSLIGPGRLNVAIENGGKFVVDKECQAINAYFFVGQSYPSISPSSLGTLEFDTTDSSLTYTMSVRSMVSVAQKGTVNFVDESKMSDLALVDYGTVNLGSDVVLTTPTMGLLHAILVGSGGVLNTANMGTVDTVNGDLNVLSGGTLKMNGDGLGLYSNLIVNGTLTVSGTVNVGFDLGYVNGSAIQANQTNILQGSTLNITTTGTPQPTGFPYFLPVIYGPITGTFSTVNGVNDPVTFNDGQEMIVEWTQQEPQQPTDDLLWVGKDATNPTDWNTADNWLDITTGSLSTLTPSESNNVFFNNSSPLSVNLGYSGNCKTLHTSSGWNGNINLISSPSYITTLSIGHNSFSSDQSEVDGGTIRYVPGNNAANQPVGLLIIGGTFNYNATYLGDNSASGGLYINVYNSNNWTSIPHFIVGNSCTHINAGFNVGAAFYGQGESPGAVEFNTTDNTTTFQNTQYLLNYNLYISTSGWIIFDNNTYLSGIKIQPESPCYGTIYMGDPISGSNSNVTLTMAPDYPTMYIGGGGRLKIINTGTVTIGGNIEIEGLKPEEANSPSGTLLIGGDGKGNYGHLIVNGNLTFDQNSVYDTGVDLETLNSGMIVVTGDITIASGVTCQVSTEGTPGPSGQNYNFSILLSNILVTGNFSTITQKGSFENWNTSNDGTSIHLKSTQP